MASSSFSVVKKEDDETSSKSSGSTKRCPFCKRDILEQDSLIFGQAEVSENYTVHYFCVLLATQLLQRGDDDDGIKGFLHADIQREIRRARKTRCCYCNAKGATVSCASPSCRRVFHFPCGFEAGAVPDFGSESFSVLCGEHFRLERRRQEQKQRRVKQQQREAARSTSLLDDDDDDNNNGDDDNDDDGEYGTPECLVCLSRVDVDLRHGGSLPPDLFISPCCRQIYEKNCLRGYAGVAGLHHFKCSQCRNADEFLRACQREGIFVPDQDAEWERTGDFADHYVPHSTCDVLACLCPQGRATVNGHPDWEVVRCDDCGKSGTHIKCSNLQEGPHSPYQCNDCSLVGNDSSVSCPTASANKGNVRWYIESRLHEAFSSEDIVILQQEDDGNTEDVDIDDSNAVRADNKENKVATKASPVVPDFSAVSLKWCQTEATSQDDGRPKDTTAQTSNAISLVRHHTAEALDCASTPCTPSKSPSRALRQLTLHSFASPVKPYSTESDRPAANSLVDTRSSEQVCSTRVTSPRRKAAARSKAARRSIFSWSSSSSLSSSPVKKKIRRQKLQKGQTTLDGFFRSPLAMFGALRSSLGFAASSAVDNNNDNDDDDDEEEEDDKKFDLKICASSVDEQRQHRHSADVVARANKNGSRSSGQPPSRQPNHHPAAVGIDVTTRNNCTSNSNRTKLLAVKLEPGYSW